MRPTTLLARIPSIENMTSSNGNDVPNQFIIRGEYNGENYTIFKSYNSIIVMKVGNKVFIDKAYWDYSRTTAKYRNQFLRETTAETELNLKLGRYKFAVLN
jgi:hypothetical protein